MIPIDFLKGADGGSGDNRYGPRQSPTVVMGGAGPSGDYRLRSGKLMARQSLLPPGSTQAEVRPSKLIVLTEAGGFAEAVERLLHRIVDEMARAKVGFPRRAFLGVSGGCRFD